MVGVGLAVEGKAVFGLGGHGWVSLAGGAGVGEGRGLRVGGVGGRVVMLAW